MVARIERHGRDYVRLATTGGVQFPDRGRSEDHLMLVTVGDDVTMASIDTAGLRDAGGGVPGCAEDKVCSDAADTP